MKIRIREREGPRPSRLKPPGERPGTVIVRPGRATPPDLPVYCTREVYLSLWSHAKQGARYEVGGFLLGGYHTHPLAEGVYLDIKVAVPALKAKSEKASLSFDNEAQRALHACVTEDYPDQVILGWYHTHPGYGVFLSEHDLFIHRSFFAASHHVAVVVDPYEARASERIGVFVWEPSEGISQGYHLIVYAQE